MFKLKINEIFYSLQGETRTVGLPTVFVRLTGCPLRCSYCDTEYAFHEGKPWSFDDIISEINKYNTRYVTVTGGEPLAQRNCIELLKQLCDLKLNVSLETSGALDVSAVDKRVMKVMDIKTPSSNEKSKNKLSNLDFINQHDQIKFVIGNRDDYNWSVALLKEYNLSTKCEVLFSPVNLDDSLDIVKPLAEWVLEDQLSVRFQIQLHKTIWGNVPGV